MIRSPPRALPLFLHYLRKAQQKEGRACSPKQCHDIAEMLQNAQKMEKNKEKIARNV